MTNEITKAELETKANNAIMVAANLQVTNDGEYQQAGEFLTTVKGLANQIKDFFSPMKSKAHAAWKEIVAQENKHLGPLAEAEAIAKGKLVEYLDAQEKIRAAEQAVIDARAKAAAELLQKQAAEAEKSGNAMAADALRNAAMTTQAEKPILESSAKATGVGSQKSWTYRITDASKLPREYLTPDEKKIGAMVKAAQGTLVIPGVEIFQQTIIKAKGR